MADPYQDYIDWLQTVGDQIEHGHWEAIDLETLSETVRGIAREEVRQLQLALVRWLRAGVDRDSDQAGAEMATIRTILERSPSLADWEALRQRVHTAWRTVARDAQARSERLPSIGYTDLDRAAGKIRRQLDLPL